MSTFWACARTHPRQEEIALNNLRRQKFNAFFPFFLMRKTTHSQPDGFYLAKPAFPSYIFIELDDEIINWAPINFTLGIQRLLTYSDGREEYRLPCRANFIEDLRRIRILPSDRLRDIDLIPIGTTVRIKRGPLSERIALVEMSSARRVGVLLELFGRQVSVEIEVDAVERIDPPIV